MTWCVYVLGVIFGVHVECVHLARSWISVEMGRGFHSGSVKRPLDGNYNTNS